MAKVPPGHRQGISMAGQGIGLAIQIIGLFSPLAPGPVQPIFMAPMARNKMDNQAASILCKKNHPVWPPA